MPAAARKGMKLALATPPAGHSLQNTVRPRVPLAAQTQNTDGLTLKVQLGMHEGILSATLSNISPARFFDAEANSQSSRSHFRTASCAAIRAGRVSPRKSLYSPYSSFWISDIHRSKQSSMYSV